MRQIILIFGLLFAASAAQAAQPTVRIGGPYNEVRASLIAQGFIPQRVTEKQFPTVTCRTDGLLCRLYPELEWCTPFGVHGCLFLFRDRRDGSYWRVLADGNFASQKDHPDLKVSEVHRTTLEKDGVRTAGDDIPSTAQEVPEPTFAKGTPYAAVRAAFISQGFTPQPAVQRDPKDCPTEAVCKQYPELEACGTKTQTFCGFLFKGRPGFGWWRVIALVEKTPDSQGLSLTTTFLRYTSDEELNLSNPPPRPGPG
jgi:hypothetical protein